MAIGIDEERNLKSLFQKKRKKKEKKEKKHPQNRPSPSPQRPVMQLLAKPPPPPFSHFSGIGEKWARCLRFLNRPSFLLPPSSPLDSIAYRTQLGPREGPGGRGCLAKSPETSAPFSLSLSKRGVLARLPIRSHCNLMYVPTHPPKKNMTPAMLGPEVS